MITFSCPSSTWVDLSWLPRWVGWAYEIYEFNSSCSYTVDESVNLLVFVSAIFPCIHPPACHSLCLSPSQKLFVQLSIYVLVLAVYTYISTILSSISHWSLIHYLILLSTFNALLLAKLSHTIHFNNTFALLFINFYIYFCSYAQLHVYVVYPCVTEGG